MIPQMTMCYRLYPGRVGSIGRCQGCAGASSVAIQQAWWIIAIKAERIASLERRVGESERRLGADSSTSNRLASWDSPYHKPVWRSLAYLVGAPAG